MNDLSIIPDDNKSPRPLSVFKMTMEKTGRCSFLFECNKPYPYFNPSHERERLSRSIVWFHPH